MRPRIWRSSCIASSRPFAGAADAIEVAGKPFKVAPSSVVPFSLVLHELATNAAKYGALSAAQGRARISWKYYRTESGERRFKFKWEESGGPSVAPPRRSGFGTILMKRAFADVDAQSRLTHAPEGLRYKIDAPVSGRLGRPPRRHGSPSRRRSRLARR